MKQKNRHTSLCFVVTDAQSFNALCKGQFEYYKENFDVDLTFVCGGSGSEIDQMRMRNVGGVVDCGLTRRPQFINDIKVLSKLTWIFYKNRFDVVIYSTPKALLLTSIAAAITRQNHRIALIRGRVYENSHGVKRLAWSLADRLSIALSHKTIFISRSLLDAYLSDKIVEKNRGVVVGKGSSGGVSLNRFFPRADRNISLRGKLRIPADAFVVLSVGRLCLDKGVKDLEEIILLTESKKIHFVAVGPIEDSAAKEIIETTFRENTRCHYVGFSLETQQYFSMADLHLFLTHREGFGNVALEAAASGLPTVAYDVVGVRDSVAPGKSGWLFDRGRSDLIHKFISHISETPEDLVFLRRSARLWAEKNFDEEIVWKAYFDEYTLFSS